MPTPIYPSWNDKEYDLLKKMTENTALIADYEIGDVASVAGTAGNVLVNGGTAAATGAITLSLPSAIRVADGTLSAPVFSFSADSDTGLFRAASGSVAYASNGIRTFAFPTVTGSSGQFLTTDGAGNITWGTGSGTLPSQTGNAGKLLTTDGVNASWSSTLAGNLTVSGTGTVNSTSGTSSGLVVKAFNTAGGNVQYWADFQTSGGLTLARFIRGNAASGYNGNGLNVDSYEGFQIKLNTLGGSGGAFSVLGGDASFGGNLTVSGTGTSSFASGSLLKIGLPTNAPNKNLGGNLLQVKSAGGIAYITIGNGDGANNTSYIGGASSYLLFGKVSDAGSTTEFARFIDSGNYLIGKTIDSSNGRLQLADHTTSAGGIGFGTDISLYRPQAGVLAIDGSQAALYLRDSGTTKGRFNVTASTLYIDGVDASGSTGQIILRTGNGGGTALTLGSDQSAAFSGSLMTLGGGFVEALKSGSQYLFSTTAPSGSFVFRTGSYTTALTLDSSQNAIFAGSTGVQLKNDSFLYFGSTVRTAVKGNSTGSLELYANNNLSLTLDSSANATFAGNDVTVNGGSTSSTLTLKRASNSYGAVVSYNTTTTNKWFHGLRGLTNDNWYLYNNVAGNNALIFDAATSDATFAGAITSSRPYQDISSGLSNIYVYSTDTAAQDKGGTIQLGGAYTGTTTTTFGGVRGSKESTTAGETGGQLEFFTRANGGAMTRKAYISSTGNATFTGSIAIGNTVNTVSPTSPNRTITMVIGGTTYYLHAKTTND